MMSLSSLTAKSPDVAIDADAEAVMQAFLSGTRVDLDVAHRIQERSRLIREEIFRKHGLADIAVPAICDLRGPLP